MRRLQSLKEEKKSGATGLAGLAIAGHPTQKKCQA